MGQLDESVRRQTNKSIQARSKCFFFAIQQTGDPSGRTTERSVIASDELQHNLKSIEKQIQTIFDNHRQYLWNEKTDGKLKPLK